MKTSQLASPSYSVSAQALQSTGASWIQSYDLPSEKDPTLTLTEAGTPLAPGVFYIDAQEIY